MHDGRDETEVRATTTDGRGGLIGATILGSPTEAARAEALRAALGATIAAALGSPPADAWQTLVAALTLLGSERLEGWKVIAAAMRVSITRARELADRRRSFRLPVRYGARGVYITRLALALWLAQYDVPYGAQAELKRPARGTARSGKASGLHATKQSTKN